MDFPEFFNSQENESNLNLQAPDLATVYFISNIHCKSFILNKMIRR